MIDLIKEKTYSAKDPKLNTNKQTIMFDKFRIAKFSAVCSSDEFKDGRIVVYIGLTNGTIFALTLFKSKGYHKYEDFIQYKVQENLKHRGPVNVLITEPVEGVPVLFSGGADGSIKMWQGDPELREKDMVHHIKTLLEHKGTIMSLAFCKSRSILVSSSSDMTLKCFRMKEKFDKLLNPRFECILIV